MLLKVVEAVFRFIRFVILLTIDIIATALWLVSLVVPTRTLGNILALAESEDRGEYRVNALACFGMSILDLLCFPVGLVGLVSIVGTPYAFWELLRAMGETKLCDSDYNWQLRGACWVVFLYSINQLLTLPMLLLLITTCFRFVKVIKDWDTSFEKDTVISERQAHTYEQFFYWCCDLLAIPFLVVLLLSWRSSRTIDRIKAQSSTISIAIAGEFALLLVDLPFAIMSLIMFLTLWRAYPLFYDLRHTPKNTIRPLVWAHFLAWFLDIFTFLGLAVVVGSIIRIGTLITGFIAAYASVRYPKPETQSLLVAHSVTAHGPGKGLHISVSGALRHPESAVDIDAAMRGASTMLFYISGDDLFETVSELYGGMASKIGQGLLPLKMEYSEFEVVTTSPDVSPQEGEGGGEGEDSSSASAGGGGESSSTAPLEHKSTINISFTLKGDEPRLKPHTIAKHLGKMARARPHAKVELCLAYVAKSGEITPIWGSRVQMSLLAKAIPECKAMLCVDELNIPTKFVRTPSGAVARPGVVAMVDDGATSESSPAEEGQSSSAQLEAPSAPPADDDESGQDEGIAMEEVDDDIPTERPAPSGDADRQRSGSASSSEASQTGKEGGSPVGELIDVMGGGDAEEADEAKDSDDDEGDPLHTPGAKHSDSDSDSSKSSSSAAGGRKYSDGSDASGQGSGPASPQSAESSSAYPAYKASIAPTSSAPEAAYVEWNTGAGGDADSHELSPDESCLDGSPYQQKVDYGYHNYGSKKHEKNDCYLDSLQTAVLQALLQLAFDVVAIIAFFLTWLHPYRLYQLFGRLGESKQHREARKRARIWRKARKQGRRCARTRLSTALSHALSVPHSSAPYKVGLEQLFGILTRDSPYEERGPLMVSWDVIVQFGKDANLEETPDITPAMKEVCLEIERQYTVLTDLLGNIYQIREDDAPQVLQEASQHIGSLYSAYEDMFALQPNLPSIWKGWKLMNTNMDAKRMICINTCGNAFLDFVALICALLLIATLYRIRYTRRLYKRKREWGLRKTLLMGVGYLLLDIGYLLLSLLIILTVFPAIPFLLEVIEAAFGVGLDAAQEVVLNYADNTALVLFEIMSLLAAWKTYKMAFGILVWGAVAPAEAIARAFVRILSLNDCTSYIITSFYVAFGFGYPLLLRFALLDSETSEHNFVLYRSIFVGLMLMGVVFIIMYAALPEIRDDRKDMAKQVANTAYTPSTLAVQSRKNRSSDVSDKKTRGRAADVHWTWPNTMALLLLVSESAQMCIAVLRISEVSYGQRSVFQSVGDVLLTPEFGFDDWRVPSITAMVLAGIWICVYAAPLVSKELFRDSRFTWLVDRPVWQLLSRFLSGVLFLSIMISTSELWGCQEVDSPSGGTVLILSAHPEVVCFEGQHLELATAAMILLFTYVPTSFIHFATQPDEADPRLDVLFSPSVHLTMLCVKVTIAVVTVLHPTAPTAQLTVISLVVTGGLVFMIVLNRLHMRRERKRKKTNGHSRRVTVLGRGQAVVEYTPLDAPATPAAAYTLRVAALAAAWWACVCMIWARLRFRAGETDDESNNVAIALFTGWGAIVLAVWISACARTGSRARKGEFQVKPMLWRAFRRAVARKVKDLPDDTVNPLLMNKKKRMELTLRIRKISHVPVNNCVRCNMLIESAAEVLQEMILYTWLSKLPNKQQLMDGCDSVVETPDAVQLIQLYLQYCQSVAVEQTEGDKKLARLLKTHRHQAEQLLTGSPSTSALLEGEDQEQEMGEGSGFSDVPPAYA